MLLQFSRYGPSYGRISQLESDDEMKDDLAQAIQPRMSYQAWLIHGILLLISSTLLISSLFTHRMASINGNGPKAAQWSSELTSIPSIATKFHGSFLAPSKFRGLSPSTDEEWERFTFNPYIDGTSIVLGVTEEDIRKSSKVTSEDWFNTTVVLHKGNTREDTRYMATLEIFHQMHCLDMLRKSTFEEQYKDDDSRKHGHTQFRNHLDHCLEIIRQVVMCNSDPGLITFHWVKDNPVPYPDFNTWHQCRDVDATLEWGERNAWPLTDFVRKKQGVLEMPEAP